MQTVANSSNVCVRVCVQTFVWLQSYCISQWKLVPVAMKIARASRHPNNSCSPYIYKHRWCVFYDPLVCVFAQVNWWNREKRRPKQAAIWVEDARNYFARATGTGWRRCVWCRPRMLWHSGPRGRPTRTLWSRCVTNRINHPPRCSRLVFPMIIFFEKWTSTEEA